MRFGPCDIPFSTMGQLHLMDEWEEPCLLELEDGSKVMAQKRKCSRCKLIEYRRVKVGV